MIQIKNISKQYGKKWVLKDINLDITSPQVVAILGPNGSGKSTLTKTLMGMVIPTKGKIVVNDQSIKGGHQYREQISYLPQTHSFPANLTSQEVIDLVTDIRGPGCEPDELIEQFELEEHLDVKVGHLSSGTAQKLNLVLSFMYNLPIIVLDEPCVGLDPIAFHSFKTILKKQRTKEKVVIMSTHIMNLAEEMAERIVFLLEGKVCFDGNPHDLMKAHDTSNLEEAIVKMMKSSGNNLNGQHRLSKIQTHVESL